MLGCRLPPPTAQQHKQNSSRARTTKHILMMTKPRRYKVDGHICDTLRYKWQSHQIHIKAELF